MRLPMLVFVLGLAGYGCGDGERERADHTPAAQQAQGIPSPITTPEQTVEAGRSVPGCLKLWNADEARGSTHQVSHTDFVVELVRERGSIPALVEWVERYCYVTVPVGRRRIAQFDARDGRAPFSNPQRRNLKSGERVPYNGRVLPDGKIKLRRGQR